MITKHKFEFLNFYVVFSLFLFVVIDLLSKWFFTNKSFFIGSLFFIEFSKNTGSAFSLFSSVNYYNVLIMVLSVIVLIFLYFNLDLFEGSFLYQFSLVLLVSGIIGNFLDRISLGYVRDFMGVKYFGIFNMADVYLSFAVMILVYLEFFKTNRDEEKKIVEEESK